jgi:hypothetical protein
MTPLSNAEINKVIQDVATLMANTTTLQREMKETNERVDAVEERVATLEKALSWFKGASYVAIGLLTFIAACVSALVYDFLKWGFATGFNWTK